MVEIPAAYYLQTGEEGGEGGRPPYKTKDGHVVISATSRDMATRLMTLVSGEATDATPINSSTADDRRRALDEWCATRTTDDVVAALLKEGVPVAPVKTIPQVVKDPHMWAREMMVKLDDPVAGEIYAPGVTIKMSATPGRVGPVPTPGQHTDEILSRVLNLDAAKLDALRQAKVIG
jgi:crotonobetainyl-CoA:carnitine CoA-transferase CaiB-like acyl-CoA transferase